MLTHLKLENFKIWRTTRPVRLAPLTFLLGTNSSGKSSLIQSLLLVRQTVNSGDPNLDLNLGNPDAGDSVTLGRFQDVLSRHAATTETLRASQIGIEFRWSATGAAADSSIFSAIYQRGPAGSAELSRLRIGVGERGFTVERHQRGIYRLFLDGAKRPLGQGAVYRPERSFAFSPATLNLLGERAELVRGLAPALLAELGKVIYLGPVRRLAQRDYVWSGRMPGTIGDDGRRAIDVLIASGAAREAARRRRLPEPPEARLFEQAIRWLKTMNLADDLAIRTLGQSARHELLIGQQGEFSNLKDVGVGVSQVLPVLVAALYAQPGHIVILEEPETHLHPLAQSQLAELFVTVARERNVQFIVETHSEHLFRRMQTLIAKSEVSSEKTAMYFVERTGKDAELRKLEVDKLGRVHNWPEYFFGDALGETREQARQSFVRQGESAK